jgi:hypothetical protein
VLPEKKKIVKKYSENRCFTSYTAAQQELTGLEFDAFRASELLALVKPILIFGMPIHN